MASLPNLQVVDQLDPTKPEWYKQPRRPITEIIADLSHAYPQQIPGTTQTGWNKSHLLALVSLRDTARPLHWWTLGLRNYYPAHHTRPNIPHSANHYPGG